MVVIEAPLDKVIEIDAMIKGLLKSLIKIKPDNCPVDNKTTGIDDERSGIRIEQSDELEICQYEDAKVAEATNEHVEGAQGCLVKSGFENDDMK
ncbi:38286_t:CDS:2, partial [Gigaspora margarita]